MLVFVTLLLLLQLTSTLSTDQQNDIMNCVNNKQKSGEYGFDFADYLQKEAGRHHSFRRRRDALYETSGRRSRAAGGKTGNLNCGDCDCDKFFAKYGPTLKLLKGLSTMMTFGCSVNRFSNIECVYHYIPRY